jgi:hypothetical protein
MKLDAAMRYGTASEGEDHFNQWAPSVVLKAPVGERWAVHAEYFGLFSTGKEKEFTRHFFSPGGPLPGDREPGGRRPCRLGAERPVAAVLQ